MISYANIWTTNDCFAATTTNYAPLGLVICCSKVFHFSFLSRRRAASRSSRDLDRHRPPPRPRRSPRSAPALPRLTHRPPAGSSPIRPSPEALRITFVPSKVLPSYAWIVPRRHSFTGFLPNSPNFLPSFFSPHQTFRRPDRHSQHVCRSILDQCSASRYLFGGTHTSIAFSQSFSAPPNKQCIPSACPRRTGHTRPRLH